MSQVHSSKGSEKLKYIIWFILHNRKLIHNVIENMDLAFMTLVVSLRPDAITVESFVAETSNEIKVNSSGDAFS